MMRGRSMSMETTTPRSKAKTLHMLESHDIDQYLLTKLC